MPVPLGGVNPDHFIFVPSSFQIKPGAKIRNDLFVGPGLGVGLQVPSLLNRYEHTQERAHTLHFCTADSITCAVLQELLQTPEINCTCFQNSMCCLQGGVFLLQDAQGRPDPNKVLKATFKFSLGGIAGMTHMQREWAVGRRLAPLEKLDKALPGFMATGAAVLTRAGTFKGTMAHMALLCLQQHTRHCSDTCHMQAWPCIHLDCCCRLHIGTDTRQELRQTHRPAGIS